MHLKRQIKIRTVIACTGMVICSQGLGAEENNAAELEGLSNYIALGMACSSVSLETQDQEAHDKFLDLVTYFFDKSYIYSDVERELIKDTAVTKSKEITKLDGIDGKCKTLSEDL